MLPAELDVTVYADIHTDLAGLSVTDLEQHYRTIGIKQGRRSNSIADRNAFAALANRSGDVLEIGPLDNPMLRGPNISYADYFSFEELKKKATTHGRSAETVPNIDYVLGEMTLSDIPKKFGAVLSSHCIEHQTDLIRHLQDVQKLLNDGGRYFALIPDKRYCFDAFKSETTIGEIIDAHENRMTVHPLSKVIAHFASMSHNRHVDHWDQPVTSVPPIETAKIRKAINTWRESEGRYLDVHGIYFTPDSFREIMRLLRELGYIDLHIERLYPTRFRKNEFWAVLQSPNPNRAG